MLATAVTDRFSCCDFELEAVLTAIAVMTALYMIYVLWLTLHDCSYSGFKFVVAFVYSSCICRAAATMNPNRALAKLATRRASIRFYTLQGLSGAVAERAASRMLQSIPKFPISRTTTVDSVRPLLESYPYIVIIGTSSATILIY